VSSTSILLSEYTLIPFEISLKSSHSNRYGMRFIQGFLVVNGSHTSAAVTVIITLTT